MLVADLASGARAAGSGRPATNIARGGGGGRNARPVSNCRTCLGPVRFSQDRQREASSPSPLRLKPAPMPGLKPAPPAPSPLRLKPAPAHAVAARAQARLPADDHTHSTGDRVARARFTRVEILAAARDEWTAAARVVCQRNDLSEAELIAAIVRALTVGSAGREMCINLCGETTSGKSWLLRPLALVYPAAFAKAAKDSRYPLLHLEKAEIILWQDFRLDSCPLAWDELLTLFEGDTITIARPMNSFTELVYLLFIAGESPSETVAKR